MVRLAQNSKISRGVGVDLHGNLHPPLCSGQIDSALTGAFSRMGGSSM